MVSLDCHALELSIAGKAVVKECSLRLMPGQFWGMMGANGIGKTTLMRCLAGLIEPQSGHVALGGTPILGLPRRAVARRLGMLQQHSVYVFGAGVLQTALTGRHPHLGRWEQEGPDALERARRALSAVDLDSYEGRDVTRLSGGEARRLAFASLLVQDPEVMLLDEPSNHLDLRYQVRIMSTIGDLVYGGERLAIAAMHDVNLAACYCSHVLMLFGGGQWAAGPAADMLTSANLQRLYQCPVEAIDTPSGPRFHPSFRDRSA